MTKKKNKLFIVVLSVLILILACFFGVKAVYKSYFAPKVSVTSINSNIELNDWNLIKKFLPNNINLSLKEINVSSTTEFSDSELTDLFILALREEPDAIKVRMVKEYSTIKKERLVLLIFLRILSLKTYKIIQYFPLTKLMEI